MIKKRPSYLFIIIFQIVFISSMVGCGQGPKGVSPTTSTQNSSINNIIISPSSASLSIGANQQFSAKGYSTASASFISLSPTWEIIGNIGSISSTGIFTALSTGTGKVIAKSGTFEGEADVVVNASGSSTSESPNIAVPLYPPTNLTGVGYGQGVGLQWDYLPSPDLWGFKIYRSTARDGEYLEIGSNSKSYYYDLTVEMSKTYSYKIKSYGSQSRTSDFSNVIEIFNQNIYSPLPPTNLSALKGNNYIDLNWDKNSETDIKGYSIYRKDLCENQNYVKINTEVVTSITYRDTNLKLAHLYRYVVVAVNTTNKESYYSNPVEITYLPEGVQNNPPSINISLSSIGISPNGDGVQDTISIEYNILDDFSSGGKNFNIFVSGLGNDRKTLLHKDEVTFPAHGTIVWDGTNDNGAIFQDISSCLLRISAYDDTNLYAEKQINLTVDRSLPKIENISQDKVVSPNDDGLKDSLNITFSTDEDGILTLKLKNPSQAILANAAFQVSKSYYKINILKNKLIFSNCLGNDSTVIDLSQNLVEGGYSYEISMVDVAGNKAMPQTGSFRVDLIPPVISNITALPNPFSPNGDGLDDTATISCNASEKCSITIKIYDPDNRLFREIFKDIFSFPESGNISCIWDGKSSSGFDIPLGECYKFKYVIEARDEGENLSISSPLEIIANRSFYLPYAYASPDPFSWRAGAGHTDILYEIGYDLNVSLVVIGQEGRTAKTLLNESPQSRGVHSVSWDGSCDPDYNGPRHPQDNSKVTDGSYAFKITAHDPRGGITASVQNTVRVESY